MSSKKSKSKYTDEALVKEKSITNGMIILDNNERVTGIKIAPRNIFIADFDTQNAIINNLRNEDSFYNSYITLDNSVYTVDDLFKEYDELVMKANRK